MSFTRSLFSGTSKRVEGDLTFSVNDKDYSVTPEENGDWSYTLEYMDMLMDGDYISYIEGSNARGQIAEANDNLTVDSSNGKKPNQ